MKHWGWRKIRRKTIKRKYPMEMETLHKFSPIIAKFLLDWLCSSVLIISGLNMAFMTRYEGNLNTLRGSEPNKVLMFGK